MEAGAVTHGAVRCSAWLGVAVIWDSVFAGGTGSRRPELTDEKTAALNTEQDEEDSRNVIHRSRWDGTALSRVEETNNAHDNKTNTREQADARDKAMPALGSEDRQRMLGLGFAAAVIVWRVH